MQSRQEIGLTGNAERTSVLPVHTKAQRVIHGEGFKPREVRDARERDIRKHLQILITMRCITPTGGSPLRFHSDSMVAMATAWLGRVAAGVRGVAARVVLQVHVDLRAEVQDVEDVEEDVAKDVYFILRQIHANSPWECNTYLLFAQSVQLLDNLYMLVAPASFATHLRHART